MPLRVLLARPRLLLSILVGLAIVAVLPLYAERFRGVTRILVGWDIGVALYLALAFWMIAKSEFVQIHRQSLAEDEGSFAILVLTIVAPRPVSAPSSPGLNSRLTPRRSRQPA